MAFAALAVAGSAIAGAMAAHGQEAAAKQAAAGQQAGAAQLQAAGQQAAANYQPYLQEGKSASQLLQQQLPVLSQNFNPTVTQLDNMPGFQFMQQQGLQAVQSQMAQGGLIGSGAEGKALDNYATQNALSNYGTLGQLYNQGRQISLAGLTNAAQIGENAASNVGQNLIGAAGGSAKLTAAAGQSLGAGTAGAANAYGGILSNSLNNISGTSMYENLYGNPLQSVINGFGGTGTGGNTSPSIPGYMLYAPGGSGSGIPIGNGNSAGAGFIMS